MKKSTIVTLIVSILLIALGFVLVGLGISSSYDSVEYRFGRTIYFQTSYMNYSLESRLLTSFGQMSFILGIAGVFLFAYLAIRNPKGERRPREDRRPHEEPRVHREPPRTVPHTSQESRVEERPEAAGTKESESGPVMPDDGNGENGPDV